MDPQKGMLSHSAVRRLIIHAALPIAYVITGRLGLLLAVPPGYATAVFLPAGIAVTAAFIAGAATLPGTFLGSFVLNIWIGYSIGHELDLTNFAAAFAIAVASALQAAIGGATLRRAIGYPAPFDNPRDILLFLLLAPLLCLTSATVSNGSMWALGVIQRSDLAINWMTWWVGDALGLVVALPLMLVLAGRPRALWRTRSSYVAVPMILCFALFVAIFVRVRSWEQSESLLEFQIRSQQLADRMKAALDEQSLFLEQLSSTLSSRGLAVSRRDFQALVQAVLQRFPAIRAVEWAPRISSSERRAFEAAQQSDIPGFATRERDPAGQLRRAGDRERFYPVTYIEPLRGNEVAVGFDLASDASRRAAIDAAVSSGSMVASAPIRLVQELGEEPGVLLMQSVPGGPTGTGIVLVALRMGSFIGTLMSPLESTLGLRFSDANSSRPLFDNLSASTEAAYETTLDFGTRRYFMQMAPSASYLARHHGWQSWMVLAGGVLSTGLLGALLMLGTGHTYRLRAKEEELETIINSTPFMLTRCSRDLRYLFVSESYAKMINRRPEDVAGKPIVEIMGEEGFKMILPYVKRVLQGERVEYVSEINFQDIGRRLLNVAYTPDKNAQGDTEGWIASIVDITERKSVESQRDLLIAEVNHRVKNTLAIVISIARQSFKRDQPFDVALRSFEDRIRALAQTHTRLADGNWSGVSLQTIIDDETAPYRDGNVRTRGPHISLNPKCALSLGMAFHELATNAAKYGALSRKEGSLDVSWEIEPSGDEVRLNWVESGGSAVNPPKRNGFGRLLLERALASDLNGTVKLNFREQGLACLIVFPIDPYCVTPFQDRVGKLDASTTDTLHVPKPVMPRVADGDRLTGARVLLVEDESLVALEIEEALNLAGSSVIGPFGNLTKAMEAAKREAIDVAVLDTNLNGELVYPLAGELAARRIPFLFLTGYDASNLPEPFRTMPRVSKPFDRADMIKQVRAAMVGISA